MMDEPVDRSDLIVGTMRPPAWVSRVPLLAWLLLAAATVDVWLRLAGPTAPLVLGSQTDALPLTLAATVLAVSALLVPVAVLLGPATGEVRRVLLFGALALALGEVLQVVDQVGPIFGALPGPDDATQPDALTTAGAVIRALLVVAAPGGILAGLRWAREPIDAGRPSPAARLILLAGLLAAAVQIVILVTQVIPTFAGLGVPALLLFVVPAVASVAGGLLWIGIAATAVGVADAVGDRRDWRRLARGTGILAAGQVAAVGVVALASLFTPGVESQSLWTLLYGVILAVEAAGMLLLVHALATGPRPAERPSGD